MIKYCILPLFLFSQMIAEKIHIGVIDPTYSNGVLFSEKGGVIESDKMRVQARNLELTEIDGEKILSAKDDLFLIYGKKFFIGDSFIYNFTNKKGVLKNGVCNAEGLFALGETIVFNGDGTLTMDNASLTTSENKITPFAIGANTVSMNEEYKVKAKGITLSAYDRPLLYIPSYTRNVNKKFKTEPTVSYSARWEKKQGPLFLMRYKAIDTESLKLYWRGEFRTGNKENYYALPRGAGTAIEIDYEESDNQLFKASSRNFYSYDTFYNDTDPNKFRHRYRIQGSFEGLTNDKKIQTSGKWDALSDRNMRSDFPTQLFELQTLGRTEAFVKARYDEAFTSFYIRPRINTFQGFKQELPTLKIAVKPYTISKTGAILENYFKFAYLDYVYADTLHNEVQDFGSGRLETSQSLTRHMQLGPIHATPKLGFKGIFYSNTPNNTTHFQSLFQVDFSSHALLQKTYSNFDHEVKPYIQFEGLYSPTLEEDNVYIFSVRDGYHNLNQLKLGLKNSFFSSNEFSSLPRFSCDVYAYNFLNASTFQAPFPKGYLDVTWSYPNVTFESNLGWNFQKNTYDHTNFSLSFTLSQYIAASLELRNRGKYEWKKDDFSNFMLDVARPINELVDSPLSDERTSFLTRWQIQISPSSTLQVQNHFGWRPGEPFYHESKFDLYTTITNTWKLRLSYTRSVRANQYTFGISLI